MKQLNEFENLEQAKTYNTESEYILSGSEFKAILSADGIDLLDFAISLPAEWNGIKDQKALALKLIIESGERISFYPNSDIGAGNVAYLDTLISRYPDNVNLPIAKAVLINRCTAKEYPYADVTQSRFNDVKNIVQEFLVPDWTNGKNIKLSLASDLPDPCQVTTWDRDRDNGFRDENLGRPITIQKAGDYKIKMRGVVADGTVVVRVPDVTASITVGIA